MLNSCPEDEPMMPSEDCLDAATDESLLETNPIQSPLQVFAGMGGLALIAERLPMLYPDVIQQVRLKACHRRRHMHWRTKFVRETSNNKGHCHLLKTVWTYSSYCFKLKHNNMLSFNSYTSFKRPLDLSLQGHKKTGLANILHTKQILLIQNVCFY